MNIWAWKKWYPFGIADAFIARQAATIGELLRFCEVVSLVFRRNVRPHCGGWWNLVSSIWAGFDVVNKKKEKNHQGNFKLAKSTKKIMLPKITRKFYCLITCLKGLQWKVSTTPIYWIRYVKELKFCVLFSINNFGIITFTTRYGWKCYD